jgi:hypothetical protein
VCGGRIRRRLKTEICTGACWAGPGRTIRERCPVSSRPKLTRNSYPPASKTLPTVPLGYNSKICPSTSRASSIFVLGLMAKDTGAFVALARRARSSARDGAPLNGSLSPEGTAEIERFTHKNRAKHCIMYLCITSPLPHGIISSSVFCQTKKNMFKGCGKIAVLKAVFQLLAPTSTQRFTSIYLLTFGLDPCSGHR